MRNILFISAFIYGSFIATFCAAVNDATIDSLRNVIKTAPHDSIKVKAYDHWDDLIYISDPFLSDELNKIIISICERNISGKNDTKEEYFFKYHFATALNNLANNFNDRGEDKQAIIFYNKALKIREQISDFPGIAAIYNNIGNIYSDQGKPLKALEYYTKSLDLSDSIKNSGGIAMALNGIAGIHYQQGNDSLAIRFLERSLKIREESGNKQGAASVLNNLGLIYTDRKEYDKAFECYNRSLAIKNEIGDWRGISVCYINIGNLYIQKGNETEGARYNLLALQIAEKNRDKMVEKNSSYSLYHLFKKQKKFSDALAMYEKHIAARDSLLSIENKEAVIQKELEYNYLKKAAADSVKNAEEQKTKDALLAVEQAENNARKQQTYYLYAGLTLLSLFGLFIFNRFRITQQQKKIIESQKLEVDHAYNQLGEKNKEIIDSINYAKRLQQAILTPETEIRKYFPESFLFYKPKDIVAGDFYFFEVTDSHIFYAAADCTGHGVPGAMVSIVCSNALTRCVKEFELSDPGKILDKTRELILETFIKSKQDVKDGMDISFITINRNTKEIKWAGANNPLWIVRKETSDERLVTSEMHPPSSLVAHHSSLKEYKADKQPIGKTDHPAPFTTHTIHTLPAGSWIFLFTDGYADQFGGLKTRPKDSSVGRGKKFKYSNLQKLLVENAGENPETINEKLETAFFGWKGNLEQVDDVCVIGVRL